MTIATRVFATITCTNYLAKAVLLARSVRRHHPDQKIVVCLVEKTLPDCEILLNEFDEVYLAKDVVGDTFAWLNFKYNQLESSTFVKASFLRHLLLVSDEVVYLDPDIVVYSPLKELDEIDPCESIVLTPHQLLPTNEMEVIDSSVIGFMMCGTYNLGFLFLRKSAVTDQFLDWWNHKLEYYAFLDFSRGLFTDQKWIDLATVLFPTFVLRAPGFNVANWNLNERSLKNEREFEFCGESYPLRFVHFSGADFGKDLRLARILATSECNQAFFDLRADYHAQLDELGHKELAKTQWTYDEFDSGEPIMKESKTVFLRNKKLRLETMQPYSKSNEYFQAKGY